LIWYKREGQSVPNENNLTEGGEDAKQQARRLELTKENSTHRKGCVQANRPEGKKNTELPKIPVCLARANGHIKKKAFWPRCLGGKERQKGKGGLEAGGGEGFWATRRAGEGEKTKSGRRRRTNHRIIQEGGIFGKKRRLQALCYRGCGAEITIGCRNREIETKDNQKNQSSFLGVCLILRRGARKL